MGFHVEELHSHVADKPFVVLFLSSHSSPLSYSASAPIDGQFRVKSRSQSALLFVVQMFCTRENDDGYAVTQYLGSALVDLSQCSKKTYHLAIRDASSQPPLHTGQFSIHFTQLPANLMPSESKFSTKMQVHSMQTPDFARHLFTAAEANLKLIEGFGVNGLAPIVHGLHWVHSPYYVNHMGITLPSGAFCMIPTSLDNNKLEAIQSYKQRLTIALARNTMKPKDFVTCVADMLEKNIRSKHIRCLAVVADMLTLHARLNVRYTPDVQLTPTPKGTERWEIPREPSLNGNTSFTGDCEDIAREIYQHCKELCAWVTPKVYGTALESLAVILHMYVPTIEQGAVDRNAHSKYINYEAPYRNHIWAALHPRYDWNTKCTKTIKTQHLYEKWPVQKCEKTLPMIHLEGTGEVYPIVTSRKPGFVAKMQNKQSIVLRKYPEISAAETPDMALQCRHKSNFYKYAIACMTDLFADQGILDFTYVSKHCYGVSIYDWARGSYGFKPSTIHSEETMRKIRLALSIERPISPILTHSKVIQTHHIVQGYSLRYGQKTPFQNVPKEAGYAIYDVGGEPWHEVYFVVGGGVGSASSTEIESADLLLI